MPDRQPLENNQLPSDSSVDPPEGNEANEIIAPEQVWEVSFTLTEQDNGLAISKGGDVDWEEVAVGEPAQRAFRSGNGVALTVADGNSTPDYYIQFNIDDDVIYKGSPTSRVVIEVDYLDEGTDTFNVQYDGQGGPFLDTNGGSPQLGIAGFRGLQRNDGWLDTIRDVLYKVMLILAGWPILPGW